MMRFWRLLPNLCQATLINWLQIVVGSGSQGLQSDNENKSAWSSESLNSVRDTANFQSRLRQQPRSHDARARSELRSKIGLTAVW